MTEPSTVGTTTSTSAVYEPCQRQTFYANGRHWVFYTDGINLIFRTSTDGVNWSGSTIVRACTRGSYFSIWFDGTHVHYVYVLTGNLNVPIYYRRGTPNADGTVTWYGEGEQVAVSADANARWYEPNICVDSGGYPWISYRKWNTVSGNQTPFVTKSSVNTGAWTTASGFPYELSTTHDTTWVVCPIPLTASKVYVLYVPRFTVNGFKGKLWTGSWGSEETVASSSLQYSYFFSALNEGDDIHVVFHKETVYDLIYVKRTYGTGWGSEVTIQSSTTIYTAPVLSLRDSTLYCFWGNDTTDHIYYKKCVAGTWDTNPTDWIDESADELRGTHTLSCYYKNYNGETGLVYMTKTASPYNVRFARIVVVKKAKPSSIIPLMRLLDFI